jgi:hypothetical protein
MIRDDVMDVQRLDQLLTYVGKFRRPLLRRKWRQALDFITHFVLIR